MALSLSAPLPDGTAVDTSTHLLGGVPGEALDAAVQLTMTLSIPSLDHLDVEFSGGGTVPYYLSGQVIRFHSDALPRLRGSLQLPTADQRAYRVVLTGLQKALVTTRWGNGTDVIVEGLGLRGKVLQNRKAIVTLTQRGITLTTGAITIDGQTYRGEINIAKQRIVLVGSFPMPVTGKAAIDARIAAKPVLLRLTASPQLVK